MPNIQPFEVKIRSMPGTAILDMQGDVNAFAESALNAAYAQVEEANPERVVLNFSDVHYINSTGIALIVGLLAQARKSRRPLVVYGLSDHYVEIFHITRLADFMQIFADEASALAS